MKKIAAILLLLVFLFSLTACAGKKPSRTESLSPSSATVLPSPSAPPSSSYVSVAPMSSPPASSVSPLPSSPPAVSSAVSLPETSSAGTVPAMATPQPTPFPTATVTEHGARTEVRLPAAYTERLPMDSFTQLAQATTLFTVKENTDDSVSFWIEEQNRQTVLDMFAVTMNAYLEQAAQKALYPGVTQVQVDETMEHVTLTTNASFLTDTGKDAVLTGIYVPLQIYHVLQTGKSDFLMQVTVRTQSTTVNFTFPEK